MYYYYEVEALGVRRLNHHRSIIGIVVEYSILITVFLISIKIASRDDGNFL